MTNRINNLERRKIKIITRRTSKISKVQRLNNYNLTHTPAIIYLTHLECHPTRPKLTRKVINFGAFELIRNTNKTHRKQKLWRLKSNHGKANLAAFTGHFRLRSSNITHRVASSFVHRRDPSTIEQDGNDLAERSVGFSASEIFGNIFAAISFL